LRQHYLSSQQYFWPPGFEPHLTFPIYGVPKRGVGSGAPKVSGGFCPESGTSPPTQSSATPAAVGTGTCLPCTRRANHDVGRGFGVRCRCTHANLGGGGCREARGPSLEVLPLPIGGGRDTGRRQRFEGHGERMPGHGASFGSMLLFLQCGCPPPQAAPRFIHQTGRVFCLNGGGVLQCVGGSV